MRIITSKIFLIANIFLHSFSFLSIKAATVLSVPYTYMMLFTAMVFLLLRAWVWNKLLKVYELSKVYPFSALVQVLILLYSVFIFNETISLNHIVGLGFMLFGLYYIYSD